MPVEKGPICHWLPNAAMFGLWFVPNWEPVKDLKEEDK